MSDDVEYRCFIGGLSWSTSDRALKDAFSKFGHLLDAKVTYGLQAFLDSFTYLSLYIFVFSYYLGGCRQGIWTLTRIWICDF